jgi:hypothetical protein
VPQLKIPPLDRIFYGLACPRFANDLRRNFGKFDGVFSRIDISVDMSIELYILPPLFSLPSISGSCIAALTLCNLSLDKSLFLVIESWDLSLGLPALKVGETWHRGYTNIKSHLAKQNDIDAHLTPTQKADITAWGSLIEDLGDTLAVTLSFSAGLF